MPHLFKISEWMLGTNRQKRSQKRWLFYVMAVVVLLLVATHANAETYYVDCSATTDGDGTQASPWSTIESVNEMVFSPGDHILFARNTTCQNNVIFIPHGSGTSDAPIVIDSYPHGTGSSQPVLSSSTWAVMAMQNQEYWEIKNLTLAGGYSFGFWVNNNSANPLNHLYFIGLNLYGATGVSQQRAQSGELFISNTGHGGVFNDILVDHVIAHDTSISEGIFINAGSLSSDGSAQMFGNNIVVRNSSAYNVYGDGILVTDATNAQLQNNVVYATGQCEENCGTSTPSGLWEYNCHTCLVKDNESYANRTIPYNNGAYGDGGSFDIDALNDNNTVEYNYGHDSWGYCVMLYSANNETNTNSIIRNNVCSNNEQRPNTYYNFNEGEIYISSAPGSAIDGIQIYGNIIYWNPITPGSAISGQEAIYSGSNPNFAEGNSIYSNVPSSLVWSTGGLQFSNNFYSIIHGDIPSWRFGLTLNTSAGAPSGEPAPITIFTSLDAYQAGTGLDAGSVVLSSQSL